MRAPDKLFKDGVCILISIATFLLDITILASRCFIFAPSAYNFPLSANCGTKKTAERGAAAPPYCPPPFLNAALSGSYLFHSCFIGINKRSRHHLCFIYFITGSVSAKTENTFISAAVVTVQGNAVFPPPIYGSKRSPTSDCYNAREKHTTIVRSPNLNVAFPHFLFCTLITVRQSHPDIIM